MGTPSVSVNTDIVKKMSSKKINFIKKDNKLYVQVTGSTSTRLDFKVNFINQLAFVYNANLTQETENILLTIE